jgi:transposase
MDARRLVFLDETGAKTNMTRRYGRSRKGKRAVDYAPHGHWGTTTLVAAMTVEGPIAPMALDGAMDSAAFLAYVEQVLIPQLPPDTILVMDNLSAHKSSAVTQCLEDAGVEIRYLPAYSPDLNPIEMMWSKVKTSLRAAKARGFNSLCEAIAHVLTTISSSDARAYCRHCSACVFS